MRERLIERNTKETSISLKIDLDGKGQSVIETGCGFIDHMLTLFSKHGKFDMILHAKGDINVDYHHLVEDIGIVLGQAFNEALGDKRGIKRYSSIHLPMDETLSLVTVDISGRSFLVYNVKFNGYKVGDLDVELFEEFFNAFVSNARLTLHINLLYGTNNHHIAESIFKGLGKVLNDATTIVDDEIPSTKGII